MSFQIAVLVVVDVLMMICAQMTRVMLSRQVIKETQIVEVELLAEVTVRVGKDLTMSIIANITWLNMVPQGIDVVQALFTSKHRPALEADLAESLFMSSFQMSLEWSPIWKLLLGAGAIVDHAVQCSQLQTCSLRFVIVVIDGVIFWVFVTLPLQFRVEKAPSERAIICNHNFVQICSAHWALFILQYESEPQWARMANILMVAWTQGHEFERIKAQNAVLTF